MAEIIELNVIDNTEAETETVDRAVTKWYCPNCGTANTGNFCTSCGKKKPASASSSTTNKKKTGTTTTAAKKKTGTTTTTNKKTTAAAEFKVTAAEKKLLTNFRKCNSVTKKLLTALIEKAASGDLDSITNIISGLLK